MSEDDTLTRSLGEALSCFDQGDLRRAADLLDAVLATTPGQPQALHLLGVIHLQSGNAAEAITLIDQAIAADPGQPFFHNSLGEALRAKGEPAAADAYRRAIDLQPDYLQAYNNLGIALHQAGDTDGAANAFRAALNVDAEDMDARNNLAIALQSQGRLGEAIEHLRKLADARPPSAQAWHNLSIAYREDGRLDEACEAARAALGAAPDNAYLHWNLADALSQRGDYPDAEQACRRALELEPRNAEYEMTLARILRAQQRLDDAIAALRGALAINPNLAEAHNDLAMILMAQGATGPSVESLERALDIDPRLTIAYFNLARAKRFGNDDKPTLERALRLAESEDLADDEAGTMHFALGKMLEDIGEFEDAFSHYQAGNAIVRGRVQFDTRLQEQWAERLKRAYTPGLVAQLAPYADPSETPIFVVGMPRSGTSLVEQILASHPEVYAAGELTHFYQQTRSMSSRLGGELPYPECVSRLGAAQVQEMAGGYLEALAALAPEATRYTDKLPANFMHIGLIALTFSRAHIVHCTRDPMAVCWSVFAQYFESGNAFAYDLEEVGRFYRQYQGLMAHWQRLFPNRIYTVAYEELVRHQERVSKALLEHCGLAWDTRCLRFYETERPVNTASVWEVRQPMYTAAVDRWRHFEPYLDELKQALEEWS